MQIKIGSDTSFIQASHYVTLVQDGIISINLLALNNRDLCGISIMTYKILKQCPNYQKRERLSINPT